MSGATWTALATIMLLTSNAAAAAQGEAVTTAQRAEEARTLMVMRPANVVSALRSIGLEASPFQETQDHHIFRAGNVNIYIEGCTTSHCKTVRLETGMRRGLVSLDKINQINRSYSGARVSISPDDPNTIIVDVTYNSTAGLVSFENLRSLNEYLQLAMPVIDRQLASK